MWHNARGGSSHYIQRPGGDTIELVVCEHVDAPECHLWGISDVHLGSPDCDEDLFLSDIAAINILRLGRSRWASTPAAVGVAQEAAEL